MASKSEDLHGNAPDKSDVALLIIDCINDLDFPGNEGLLTHVMAMGNQIATLKQRAKLAGIPVIYVNDNFGRWQSNFNTQVEHCLKDDVPGKPLVQLLQPEDDDYFVLKPKHSGFFCTSLEILLNHLEAKTLVLTGIAGSICVLFTANDAYLRGFQLCIPRDCVASNTEDENLSALEQMEKVLKADIRPSDALRLKP
jgi:nicotinamidase-related amidase